MKEYTRCLRCGRKLKTEAARQLGYGATCYQKMKNHKGKRKLIEWSALNDGKPRQISSKP